MSLIEKQIQQTDMGFHSVISTGNFNDGRLFLAKSYGERAQGFTIGQAIELAKQTKRFKQLADAIGVPVVDSFGHYITKNGHIGRVNLTEVVPMAGVDLHSRWSDKSIPDTEVLKDIDNYLRLYQRVWQTDFPISLDPPPANYCKGPDGSIIYIDTMPPRQKLANGSIISELPTPPAESSKFIEERYFSPKQAEVIYAQLLRALDGRDISPVQIKFAIGSRLGIDAFSHIDLSYTVKQLVLENPTPYDVDRLRFFAAEAYATGHLKRELLHEIYQQTHIGIGGILPQQENIDLAATLVKTL